MSYDQCKYCGNIAYKTNGKSELICYDRAVYGECEQELMKQEPIVNEGKKVGRNDKCPCGSGKKFKRCCINLFDEKDR
jgi:uncharacterized protein YchJ